jgi:hypothetical protein
VGSSTRRATLRAMSSSDCARQRGAEHLAHDVDVAHRPAVAELAVEEGLHDRHREPLERVLAEVRDQVKPDGHLIQRVSGRTSSGLDDMLQPVTKGTPFGRASRPACGRSGRAGREVTRDRPGMSRQGQCGMRQGDALTPGRLLPRPDQYSVSVDSAAGRHPRTRRQAVQAANAPRARAARAGPRHPPRAGHRVAAQRSGTYREDGGVDGGCFTWPLPA